MCGGWSQIAEATAWPPAREGTLLINGVDLTKPIWQADGNNTPTDLEPETRQGLGNPAFAVLVLFVAAAFMAAPAVIAGITLLNSKVDLNRIWPGPTGNLSFLVEQVRFVVVVVLAVVVSRAPHEQ